MKAWADTGLLLTFMAAKPRLDKAVRDSGVPWDEIWITTKLDNQRVSEALELSLEAFEEDYVDCYLMHWRFPLDLNDSVYTWHLACRCLCLSGLLRTDGQRVLQSVESVEET